MANKSISDKVYDAIHQIVEDLGYELVEVNYGKTPNGMALTLFIYNDSGITLDDCEKVSKAVDEPLDELNPTNDTPYSLNVSSLGLDRPIKTAKDAKRNLNKEVEVKLYSAINGKKFFVGLLSDFNDSGIELTTNETKMFFEFKKIANAVLKIDF